MRTLAILGLGGVLVLAGAVRADEPAPRVRVTVGGVSTYVGTTHSFPPSGAVLPGAVPAAPGDMPAPPPLEVPVAPAPPRTAVSGSSERPDPATFVAGNQIDLPEVTSEAGTDPGPPSAEFRERLASIYGVTAEEHVVGAWGWFVREPEGLSFNARSGNGVHRYLLGLPDPSVFAGARTAILANGTRGNVVTPNGLSLRSAPFAEASGSVNQGDTVTVVARSTDHWYLVETPSGRGWVSAWWLRFQ